MPTAQFDDKGFALYYEDGGPPDGVTDYTTLVLVHGLTINGAIFERLFPRAKQRGLRLITINLRDYSGSTPYTSAELADFTNEDVAVQASAIRRLGAEIGAFLVYACTTLGVPPITTKEGKRASGLVFGTWSLSTEGLLAIFGDPQTLDKGQKDVLQRYLRKAIAYDPPSFVYGVYPDLGMLDPISDPAIPLNDKPAAFTSWASGYYAPISSTSHITPDALCNRTEEGTPTVHALSSTDFTRIVQSDVVFRSGGLILQTSPEIHARHTRCAFLDADAVLPDVEIVALWCDRSMWMTVWGARALEELLREEPGAGKRKRPTSLVKLENANHFSHWDEPEKIMQVLCDAILSRPSKSVTSHTHPAGSKL